MLIETDDLRELIDFNKKFKERTPESERSLLLMEQSIRLVETAAKAFEKPQNKKVLPEFDITKPVFINTNMLPN